MFFNGMPTSSKHSIEEDRYYSVGLVSLMLMGINLSKLTVIKRLIDQTVVLADAT